MGIMESIVQTLGRGSEIARGRVVGVESDGRVLVSHDGAAQSAAWRCDVLVSGDALPAFEPGDEVLVLLTGATPGEGVVLGRVGRAAMAARPDEAAAVGSFEVSTAAVREKRVVIEADEELLLRVGDSSIRISRDGKVVIRGEHVLTRAKGTNRIKGGSVAIN